MPADPPAVSDLSPAARPVLIPGLRLVAGPPGSLTLVGAGVSLALPDAPEVRRVVADLAHGHPPTGTDPVSRHALARVTGAGLTEPVDRVRARAAARAAARVLVDAPDATRSPAVELLLASGVPVTSRPGSATHVLVAEAGEVDRPRVADWVRRGVAHLMVISRGGEVTVGPFVVPGRTCCLHCLDAHRADRDPGYRAMVSLLAATEPLGPDGDPALLATALGWAVRDLVSAVDGDRPSTWSATVTLRADAAAGLTAHAQPWRRHPGCGCAWADPLVVGRHRLIRP